MSERRSCHHQQYPRQKFDDRCRVLEDDLKRKNDTLDTLRYEL